MDVIESNVIGTQASSTHFTYDKMNNSFFGFKSDLGAGDYTGRLYNDACDQGFSLISAKTGNAALFVYIEEERSHENDIIAWHFRCYDPKHNGMRLTIFND